MLSIKDIEPLKYYILRIHQDGNIQRYLRFMEAWTRRKQIYDHPFGAFMRLAHALNAAIATKFFTGRDATAASGA